MDKKNVRCHSKEMPAASAAALLSGVVDYAGLFPPAALSMDAAVAEYRAALDGPRAWMLGRFVVPATRLGEFRAALDAAPAAPRDPVWRVSAIVRDRSADDLSAVMVFNDMARGAGAARVDAIESKPVALDGLDWLVNETRAIGEVYVELSLGPDLDVWLARVAAAGLRAKVRTGGVTADAFPTPATLASFLVAAVRHEVPFKATAGLHHALRGAYRLTYEPAASTAPMYGYLNLLLATCALQAGEPVSVAEAILEAADGSALRFDDGVVRWDGRQFDTATLRATRARLVSFGSCSFREPADEFAALAGS